MRFLYRLNFDNKSHKECCFDVTIKFSDMFYFSTIIVDVYTRPILIDPFLLLLCIKYSFFFSQFTLSFLL